MIIYAAKRLNKTVKNGDDKSRAYLKYVFGFGDLNGHDKLKTSLATFFSPSKIFSTITPQQKVHSGLTLELWNDWTNIADD